MKHSTAVQFVELEIAIIHQKQVDDRLLRLKWNILRTISVRSISIMLATNMKRAQLLGFIQSLVYSILLVLRHWMNKAILETALQQE